MMRLIDEFRNDVRGSGRGEEGNNEGEGVTKNNEDEITMCRLWRLKSSSVDVQRHCWCLMLILLVFL